MIAFLERIPVKIICWKTWVFEWTDIFRKRSLYQNIQWTREQKEAFDQYWKKNYGKKISPRWHKLYQSINGTFDAAYLPDVIYSTVVEPRIVPYYVGKTLSDKAIAEIFAKAVAVKIPKTIVLNSYGIFYNSNREVISQKDAVELLRKENVVVMKPTIGSSSGNGVQVIDITDWDDKKIINLLEQNGKNYIFQEKITQHDTFAALHPQSINTIRLTTIATRNGVKHWPLVVRIGRGNSAVDNIHAGGLGAGVSDDGKLKEKAYGLGNCDRKETYTKHPDTGVVFLNYQLEGIPRMIQEACMLHGHVPGVGAISWDFTVSKEGDPIMIEANMLGQGMWFSQIVNEKGMSDMMLPLIRRNG